MPSKLWGWAHVERTFIQEQITKLRSGYVVLNEDEQDVTLGEIEKLERQLESVDLALAEEPKEDGK